MIAAELLSLSRIIARGSPVTHDGQLGRREQLELPHEAIIPQQRTIVRPAADIDHANLELRHRAFPIAKRFKARTVSARRCGAKSDPPKVRNTEAAAGTPKRRSARRPSATLGIPHTTI